jgi:hypothetical protein
LRTGWTISAGTWPARWRWTWGARRGLHRCAAAKGARGSMRLIPGTNQLAWKLRQDPRVIVHEKTNARYLTAHRPRTGRRHRVRRQLHRLAKVLDTALDFRQAPAAGCSPGQAAVRGGAGGDRQGRRGSRPGSARARCRRACAWAGSRGWTVDGHHDEPDHRPEGNVEFCCRAPSRLKSMARFTAAASPSSPPHKGALLVAPRPVSRPHKLWGIVSELAHGRNCACLSFGSPWSRCRRRSCLGPVRHPVQFGLPQRWFARSICRLHPPSWAFRWRGRSSTSAWACAGDADPRAGARGRGAHRVLFLVQLAINYAWSPVFFGMRQ